MAKGEEERQDGLEIISIGKLYQGPLEKKYWSSSRGKDRYPYPVGYGAARTQNGISYKMEILEGHKGPVFSITSNEGQSCSGQTPDMAWEIFQKKGCARIKLWRGKRFSCKIDGVDLFGFKNPLVHRLLRELVANVTEIAERGFSSSSSCNRGPETINQHHTQGTENCRGTSERPELPPDSAKVQVKGKRSRRQREMDVKSLCEANHKRARPLDEIQIDDEENFIQSHQRNQSSGNPSISSASTEKNAEVQTMIEVANNSLSAGHGSQVDSSNYSKKFEKEKFLGVQVETNDISPRNSRSSGDASLVQKKESVGKPMSPNTEGFSVSNREEKEGEASVAMDSQIIIGADLAPDTFDLLLDSTRDAELGIPIRSHTVNSELSAAQMVVAENLVMESQAEEEIIISSANDNSEKTDSDPVGQDIAKSMMTVLLPRALPLLKTFKRKKKATTNCLESPISGDSSHEERKGNNLSADVASPAKIVTNNIQEENKKEMVHVPSKLPTEEFQVEAEKGIVHLPATNLLLPTLEDSISVAPDSYETDQCERTEYTQQPLFQPSMVADQNQFNQDTSALDNVGLAGYLDYHQSQSVSEVETSACITNLYQEMNQLLDKQPENPISPGFISPIINDIRVHSVETSMLHANCHQRKDVKISLCHIEGQVGEKGSCAGTERAGIINVATGNDPDSVNKITNGDISASEFRGEICSTATSSPASDNCQANSGSGQVKRDSETDDLRFGERPHNLHGNRSSMDSKVPVCYISKITSDHKFVWTSTYNDTDMSNTSMPCDGKLQAGSCEHSVLQSHYEADGAILSLPEKGESDHNMTANKEGKSGSSLNISTQMKHAGEPESVVQLLGCYVHPMPISLVLLRTKGSEIHIGVLCGYLKEKEKTLFIFKAPITVERRGFPSFVGHTSILLPDSLDKFGKAIALDSCWLQFTPDGRYLVLLNRIKAPYCRQRNVNCPCSACTSDCFEKNAVKVVHVKFGYIQVLYKLKATSSICCILVCEPNYLLAAEESGRVYLWTMNSTWSAQKEESYLPRSDCSPIHIVEMKRVPNCAALVVGHNNTSGEFYLWDISKRILVSNFSASSTFLQFLPVNFFRCPSQGFLSTGHSRDVHNLKDKANLWLSKESAYHFSISTQEDVAISILLSDVSNLDLQNELSKDSRGNPVGCWNLALLAKNKVILGSALEPRAAVVGTSAGYVMASSYDGHVYMWDLSTGIEHISLHHCKGAKVLCIAADDSDSGAFGVAMDGGELQIYLHTPTTGFSKREV